LDIVSVVEDVLNELGSPRADTLETVLDLDGRARDAAERRCLARRRDAA
ncbi:MAG: hypothetical protein JOY70_10415, partial [Acidisphaera sp.]|nr:hypothetical protein [Acidisphaera sp.]